jgi:hypothetical protein
VQVFPASVRAACLARNGQCRESNHDGCVASIDMRDYQQFRKHAEFVGREYSQTSPAWEGTTSWRAASVGAQTQSTSGSFHHSMPALNSGSTILIS